MAKHKELGLQGMMYLKFHPSCMFVVSQRIPAGVHVYKNSGIANIPDFRGHIFQ